VKTESPAANISQHITYSQYHTFILLLPLPTPADFFHIFTLETLTIFTLLIAHPYTTAVIDFPRNVRERLVIYYIIFYVTRLWSRLRVLLTAVTDQIAHLTAVNTHTANLVTRIFSRLFNTTEFSTKRL